MPVNAAVCGTEFTEFLTNVIFPLAAYAGVIAAAFIGISLMIGQAIRNAKIIVWAKTEVVQLIISFFSLVLLGSLFSAFCTIDMSEVAGLFGIDDYSGEPLIFDAAEEYLVDAAIYSHNALIVIRYHLEGYTVLGYMGMFECDFRVGGTGWGCYFGYSGTQVQPFGGYAALMAALNVMFNSSLMSYLMSLNYLMILIYVYKGFAFFLFPIGIFLRSMPYMRKFGSLLLSIAISFALVYPLFLAIFNLMGDSIFKSDPGLTEKDYLYDAELDKFLNENVYPDNSAGVGASLASVFEPDFVHDLYFPHGEKKATALAFGGAAFIVAFFLPSIAFLAAIASVTYLARLYGQEVDLSRLMQMV